MFCDWKGVRNKEKKIKLDKYWAMYLVVEHIVKAYDIGMTLAGTQ